MAKALYRKLGIKPDMKCAAVGCPLNYIVLTRSTENVEIHETIVTVLENQYDFIHIFSNDVYAVEESMLVLKNRIKSNGMIWFSWYKKSSKKQGLVNEDVIRNTALSMKLVDIKACSVNSDWSALKIVIPLIYR